MADQAEPLRLLARALDQAADLIKGIKPEQADLRTCRSWTVHHLVAHLVADLGNFAARVRGADGAGRPPRSGTTGPGAFATARRGLDDAWARPETGGAENPPGHGDQQLAELRECIGVVHVRAMEREVFYARIYRDRAVGAADRHSAPSSCHSAVNTSSGCSRTTRQ